MIVACGDSFFFDDPNYPNIHWTSKIPNLINLSIPGATNSTIHMQIDHAIKLQPKLIAVSFTSCSRTIVRYNQKNCSKNILDRIHQPTKNKLDCNLVSFPYAGANLYDVLNNQQLALLKDYLIEFVDLDLLRQENYYIIKSALEHLVDSNIPFRYSLGGFDHKSFCEHSPYNFDKFIKYEAPINLWDYCTVKKKLRPWYHVTDEKIQNSLAEYYKCLIKS